MKKKTEIISKENLIIKIKPEFVMKIQFMKDAAKLVEIQELLVLSMLFNNNRAHTHKSRTHTQELL